MLSGLAGQVPIVITRKESMAMTLEQIERRVDDLEQQVAAMRRETHPLQPLPRVEETFGMFADDPAFDDVVRFGREYREQANAQDQ